MKNWIKHVVRLGVLLSVGGSALWAQEGSLASDTSIEQEVSREVLLKQTRDRLFFIQGGDREVMTSYDKLARLLLEPNADGQELSVNQLEQIGQAVLYAAKVHQEQKRKHAHQEPYICHPLRVAYDLIQIGKSRDEVLIISALLHDSGTKPAAVKEIKKQFGSKVAEIVAEVGQYPISADESKQRQLMIHATELSAPSIQIVLADLLYSLEELAKTPPTQWKKAKIDHYYQWAQALSDRFSPGSSSLHDAVNRSIAAYWEDQ